MQCPRATPKADNPHLFGGDSTNWTVGASLPGASAKEVEERISAPLKRMLRDNTGIEYIYPTSQSGMSLVTVRLKVGKKQMMPSSIRTKKLAGSTSMLPPSSDPPLIKVRLINDVPVMTLTLSGQNYNTVQ